MPPIFTGRPVGLNQLLADEFLNSATNLMESEQARTMAGFSAAAGPQGRAVAPLSEVDPGMVQQPPPVNTHQRQVDPPVEIQQRPHVPPQLSPTEQPQQLSHAQTQQPPSGQMQPLAAQSTQPPPAQRQLPHSDHTGHAQKAPAVISLGGLLYQPAAFQQTAAAAQQPPFYQHQPPYVQQAYQPQAAEQNWPVHSYQQFAPQQQQQQQAAWPEAVSPNPPAAATLPVLRACLKNLAHLSDSAMMSTDFNMLIQLNESARAQPAQDMHIVAAQAFAAAAAVHMGQPQHSLPDPGVKMAKNLESLKASPVLLPAGPDDRTSVFHPARFMGGMACLAQKMWLGAREEHGLEGILPLANYDMAASGLGGCVTARGWQELHNPASTHLTIKLFSASNLGSSTGNTRRFTLAGDEDGISIGDHLKEIEDLEELQQAMRVICMAAHLALPWNHSFNALHGFLHTAKWGEAELAGNSRRAATLIKFVNHVLGLNAEAWQLKNPFMSIGELKTRWTEWLATRPASEYSSGPTNTHTRPNFNAGQAGGQFSKSARRKASRSQQQQFTLPNMSTPPPTQQNHGQQGGRPGPKTRYCRKFNAGTCLNAAGSCFLTSGTPLLHLCDRENGQGGVCHKNHAKIHHR